MLHYHKKYNFLSLIAITLTLLNLIGVCIVHRSSLKINLLMLPTEVPLRIASKVFNILGHFKVYFKVRSNKLLMPIFNIFRVLNFIVLLDDDVFLFWNLWRYFLYGYLFSFFSCYLLAGQLKHVKVARSPGMLMVYLHSKC